MPRSRHLAIALLLAAIGCDQPPDEPAAPQAATPPMSDSIGAPLGALSRAIVAANGAAERQMKLLARLEVQDGELLEFYESRAGLMLVSGAGAPPNGLVFDPKSVDRLGLRGMWRKGVRDRDIPMPAALEQAVVRAEARAAARPDLPRGFITGDPDAAGSDAAREKLEPKPGPSQIHAATGYCQSGYFSDGLGNCDSSRYDRVACPTNWWDGYTMSTGKKMIFTHTNACAITGPITLYNEYGGLDDSTFAIPTDTVRWEVAEGEYGTIFSTGAYFFLTSYVRDAIGKSFHYRYWGDLY